MATNKNWQADVGFDEGLVNALASGQLNEGASNRALDMLTGGEWSAGSVVDPRYPDISNEPVLPNFTEWQEQWKVDPTNTNLRGPNGQALPQLAEGWDYWGRAYYGEGLVGWMKGTASRFVMPFTEYGEAPDVTAYQEGAAKIGAFSDAYRSQWEAIKAGDWKTYADNQLSLFGLAGEAVSGLWGGIEETGGVIGLAAKEVGAAVGSVIEGFDQLGKFGKQVIGTGALLAQWAANPALNDTANIPAYVKNSNRYDPDPLPPAEYFGDRVKEAWETSRILGTAIYDQTIQHEYLRRLRAGEDPRWLAMELQNPLAEMAAEMAFDPLNWIAPIFKAAAWASRYDKLSDAVKLSSSMTDLMTEGAIAASKVDDAGAAAWLNDVTNTWTAQVRKVAAGTDTLAGEVGFAASTAAGKRSTVQATQSIVMGRIVQLARKEGMNADDVVKVFTAIRQASNVENADDVRKGISILKHFPYPDLLFSDSAAQLGVMLNKMGDPAKFVDQLAEADTFEKVLEVTERTLARGLENAFPTIGERVAKVDELTKAGKPIPAGLEPGALARRINAGHEAGSKTWGKVTQMYSRLFFGTNPGYAARNLQSNAITIWVDEGFRAAFRPFKNVVKDAERYGLQYTQAVKDRGVAGQIGEVFDINEPFNLSLKNWKGNTAKLSQILERRGSLRTTVAAYERSLRRYIRDGLAIPSTDELVTLGMSNDDARLLKSYLIDNIGNQDAALSAWRKVKEDGFAEIFRQVDYHLSPEDVAKLDKIDQGDALRNALKSDTLEEAEAALDEVLGAYRSDASNAYKEHYVVDPDNMQDLDEDLAAIMDGDGITEDAKNLISDKGGARNHAITQQKELVRNYYAVIEEAALKAKDTKTLEKLSEIRRKYDGYMEGRVAAGERTALVNRRTLTLEWSPTGANSISRKERLKRVTKHFGGDDPIGTAYRQWGLGEPPPDKDIVSLYDALWQKYYVMYDNTGAAIYNESNKLGATFFDELQQLKVAPPHPQASARMNELDEWVRAVEKGAIEDEALVLPANFDEIVKQNPKHALQVLAKEYGIREPKHLLRAINKQQKLLGAEEYENLADVPFDVGRAALDARAVEKGGQVITDVKVAGTPIKPPQNMNVPPTGARAILENADGFEEVVGRLKRSLRAKWGNIQTVGKSNPELDAAFTRWEAEMQRRVEHVKTVSQLEANAARDFTLINYSDRRSFDLAVAYLFPYAFWHTRTYANWMRRLVTDGDAVARYAHYRDMMEKIHADQPDWFKYNINSNELLGIDSDNPLIFNLEAAMNPLNSIVKEDFNDPQKRVNWWTNMLDDLGKFGPSTHPALAVLTAIGLMAKGEEEAAARWGGRLAPFTQAIKSVTNQLGIGNIGPFGTAAGQELDPWVILFSDGMTPYERNRAALALGAMLEKYPDQREAIFDAARNQSGPLWDEAVMMASNARDYGNIASYLFGVGWKGRTPAEAEISKAQSAWYQLWAMRSTLTPDEFRIAIRDINKQFPQLEPILLARKGGDERDTAYAYNILNRLPPGDSLAAVAGIPYDLVSQFYESKGDMSEWTEGDRLRFMGAIVDAGALLQIPSEATRNEWDSVRDMRAQMNEILTNAFGADIYDKIDGFYNAEDRKAYLEAHPDVSLALDLKGQMLVSNPQVAAYYGGIDAIEKYYNGLAASKLEKTFPGVDALWGEYWLLKDTGKEKEATAFYRNHPILKQYNLVKAEYKEQATQAIISLGLKLPQVVEPELRTDIPVEGIGQQEAQEQLQPEQQYRVSNTQWRSALGTAVYNQVIDLVYSGEPLDTFAANKIQQLALQLGMSEEELIQQISQSINQ